MIWAYAITDDVDTPLPEEELATVRAGGVCAVVSEHGGDTGGAALLRHERVVEALMTTRAVLPLRFGAMLHDQEAVRRTLDEHGAEWAGLLERLRGRVELAASVPADPPPPAPVADDGREYLMRKVEYHRRAVELAERIDKAVGDLAEARHQRVQPTPEFAVKAAYLVDRTRLDEARRRIESAGAVCTGPWPPYSFTSAERLA